MIFMTRKWNQRLMYLLTSFALLFSNMGHSVELLNNLGGDSGYGQLAMGRNDDGSSARIDITSVFPQGVNFFDGIYSSVYINTNGNITFNAPLSTYTPSPFPIASRPTIAPYWGDVDTRAGVTNEPYANNVYYAFPDNNTMVVTWHNVGYYSFRTNKLNDFQLVLINQSQTGDGNFDVEFRYNRLEWTTGNASGGSNGLGGTPAQIGFDAGDRQNYYAHPDSRTAAILDMVNTSNVGIPGVWRFEIREGEVSEPQDTLKDVVAKLYLPASTVTVDQTSYTQIPSSDEIIGDNRILTWMYDTITAGEIQDLSFDLELINPAPSASETVVYRLELDYVDVNNLAVHTELGEYQVDVLASRFEINLNTNQTSYSANTDVFLNATVTNKGAANGDATWSIVIKDDQAVVMTSLALSDVQGLVTGAMLAEQLSWNTQTYVAGNYIAELVIQDQILNTEAVASTSFSILASDSTGNDLLTLNLNGSTDKPVYHTTATVVSNDTVSNLSANVTFGEATLSMSLLDPQGNVVAQQTSNLYSMTPGSVLQRQQQWILNDAVQGIYQLLSEVIDESGVVVVSHIATFEIKEDPVAALRGNINAAQSQWIYGEVPSCGFSLENTGTLNIDSLEYQVSLVNIGSEFVLETSDESIVLNAKQSISNNLSFAANLFTVGNYACVLQHKLSGNYELIDSASFEILPPPIELDVQMLSGDTGRLLVMTDIVRQCSALEDIQVQVNWEKEFSASSDITVRIFNKDNVLVDTEIVSAWNVEFNSHHPIDDADARVLVQSSGEVEVFLTSPLHKLGEHYRVEVEVKSGWFFKETKSWDISTDCDRPFTIGEVVEDVHLLGFKLFSDSSDSVKDLDPYGPSEAPLVNEQNEFIREVLDAQGWSYTLVHSASDFTYEMRHGDYAAYVVLSERIHLPVLSQKELREHVYSGTGLLVAGGHDRRNLFVESALGVSIRGKLPFTSGLQNLDGVVLSDFPYDDHVQSIRSRSAIIELEYVLPAKNGKHNNGHSKAAAQTYNEYGEGKSIFMGFDALAIATEQGVSGEVTELLMASITRVVMPLKEPVAGREWPVKVMVNNLGTPVTGLASVLLPMGAEMVEAQDFTKQGNVWSKELNLAKGEQLEQTLYVRVPEVEGVHTIHLQIDVVSEFETQAHVEANLELSVSVPKTIAALLDKARELKYEHFFEPHLHVLCADLFFAQEAIENKHWWAAQVLLVGATNMLIGDEREEVVAVRLAIDEQIRIVGQKL